MRFGMSMAIGVALHASALAGLRLARPPVPPPAPLAADETLIDLALAPPPPAPPSPLVAPPRQASSPAPAAVAARPRHAARSPAAAPPGSAPVDTPPGTPGAVAAADLADKHAPPGANADDVAAAPRSDSLPPPLVPRAVHAPRAVFDALSAPREGSAGSGAGAQVIGVARSLADATAPRRGHGTVTIDIDAAGGVTRVSSTSPSWDAFARGLQAKLAGRRLRIQPGARGAIVHLAVSADVTSVPRALGGEAKATPCRAPDRDQAGRADAAPNAGCIDLTALLPVPRHRVSVSLAGERAL